MPRCKAKSKQTGNQCKNHASVGMEVCRFHGGKTRKTDGAYKNETAEQKILNMKIDVDDESVSDPIAILKKQLKLALNRQARLERFQLIYQKEREGTSDKGTELTEIKRVQTEPGKEMTTIHRKRDYSNELNAVTRLINKLTQTIEDIKNKKGEGAADRVTFDISYGGKKE